MTPDEIEAALFDHAGDTRSATVTRKDGRVFVGVPVATSDRLVYTMRTGRRGRPPVVHVDDLVSVEGLEGAV